MMQFCGLIYYLGDPENSVFFSLPFGQRLSSKNMSYYLSIDFRIMDNP